jgi:hypothetical protein
MLPQEAQVAEGPSGEAAFGSLAADVEVVPLKQSGTMHLFGGWFENGSRYMTSTFRSGIPDNAVKQWAADNGFDRFEIWQNGKAVFQDTLIPGKIPAGWDSLAHAGWIR